MVVLGLPLFAFDAFDTMCSGVNLIKLGYYSILAPRPTGELNLKTQLFQINYYDSIFGIFFSIIDKVTT